MTATTSIKNHLSTDDWKRKVAEGLIQCGEISRAAKTLTSQGAPLVGEKILHKRAPKHPAGYVKLEDIHFDSSTLDPIALDKETFISIVRNAPRG